MSDVGEIKDAISELSADFKSSLKGVVDNLSSVREEQAKCGVQIQSLHESTKYLRDSVEETVLKVGKLEVGLVDVKNDTEQQWDRISSIKDGGFWDKETKKSAFKIGAILLAIGMVLLAGQSDTLKNLSGLL